MTCGRCVSVVIKTIKQADPRALVEIDLASDRVRVETTEDQEPSSRRLPRRVTCQADRLRASGPVRSYAAQRHRPTIGRSAAT